jgi:hypothetical protein
MTEYRYVIVAGDGRSWLLQGDEHYDKNVDNNCVLPRLLNDGWRPIRERSFGDKDSTFALVLLKHWPDRGGDEIPF